MSANTKLVTLETFLEWEERQPLRYEWDGARTTAMVGGSLTHSAIKVNLIAELRNRLRGKPCRPFDSDAKVIVDGSVRYPDASVSCTPQTDETYARQGVVDRPVVVFEVLSVGSSAQDPSAQDRTDKNQEYRATPSIQRYVMLEQDRVAATVFSRSGAAWAGELLFGPNASLALPELDVDPIALANLYEGVEL